MKSGISCGCVLWLATVLFLPQAPAATDREIYFSFLGEQFDNELLVPLGRGTVRLLEPRSSGLFFNLPAGYQLTAVGISPRFQIQGDFEIIASYEVSAWKTPDAGYGMGPGLYLKMHDEKESAVSIGRLLRPKQKHVFNATLSTTEDAKRKHDVKLFDAQADSGKLKLVREGSLLKFSVMEGADGTFRELREVELGTADVDLLRLGAQQSDIKTPVQVLWKDLSIKAESFPNHPDTLAKGERQHVPRYQPAPQPEPISLFWSLLAGIGLLLVVGTVVWVKRRA
ncbi:MAG: DUF1583 domain-containing protein [Planctomycetaceae bacterium]|nr:DUF1583 domain-containing protein [Planctomycetaceae bacterium]